MPFLQDGALDLQRMTTRLGINVQRTPANARRWRTGEKEKEEGKEEEEWEGEGGGRSKKNKWLHFFFIRTDFLRTST